jgi:ABC-type transport system involved in cytochrome bd biosynthesis fused ATPase/permease subunit
VIERVTEDYRAATRSTLRVAFLSALVLELSAAIATALVAVEVGFRLLYGHLGYETALLVLLLTPEAFLPLLAALVNDVDVTQDLFIRGIGSPLAAALVGAGAVTVCLLRFCEPAGGNVTLEGVDLGSFAADAVRTVIGGCPQDPHIFDASIRDNLRLARPGAGEPELAAAAARARLMPWINFLPLGWDTPVGAHGAAMSGGERQRLALARALLADPAVMILDEPTAHQSPEDRAALTRDLLALTEGRATLLITHELEGLDQVDEIMVLEHGKVTQRGTYEQLIRTDGPYRQLHETSSFWPSRPGDETSSML